MLNEEVSAQELLTEAAEIAGLPDAGLGNMNDPAMNEEFTLGDIISADQAIEANLPVASVRLGNLAFAAVLSAATLLPENSIKVDLGNTVRATVGQPPQLFVAVKRRADNEIIATAQTEKITLSTKINGVLDLEVSAGGGEVRVRDIECRLPQSDSAVVADLRSSVVEASLDLPGLPSVLGVLEVVLIPGQDPPAIPAALSVESASNQRFEGFPDPVLEGRYSFEASQGLPDLLDQLNVELDILGDLLNVLEVNSPVNTALGLLGSQLDSLLNLLGLGVNEVVVRVDNMDCFNTAVLTR